MAALGCKPDVAHRDQYYEWLRETLLAKNDKHLAAQCVLSFISDSHMLSDKKEILKHVASPLCQKGLIEKDEFVTESVELLYDGTVNNGINQFDVLPLTLEYIGGTLEALIQKGEKTLLEFQRKSNAAVLKIDDELFCLAQPLLELRSLLSEVASRCQATDSSQLNRIMDLFQKVENELCAIGYQNARSSYDMVKPPVIDY